MDLTQETILRFLLEHGGRVKNSDLLNKYKQQINCSDPAEKKHNRDMFKTIINTIAVVKQIDDVKFVVVKTRYQDFLKGGIYIKSNTSVLEDSLWSLNTSSRSSLEDNGYSTSSYSGKSFNTGIQNNNVYCASIVNGSCLDDCVKKMSPHISKLGGCPNAHPVGFGSAVRSSRPNKNTHQQTSTIKVMKVAADQGINKSVKATGPVFAIVAVKSPQHAPREDSLPVRQDVLNSNVYGGLETSEKSTVLTQRSHAHLQPEPAVTPKQPGRGSLAPGSAKYTSPGGKNTKASGEMPEMSGIPQLRKSTKLSNHGEDRTSVPTKEASVFDRFSYQSVPMGSATHEWLVKSAAGLWGRVHSLLLQDPQLALTKDFISGFTALHWAAKAGNTQMVRNILDISRFRGTELDVDSRTHSGYTPLHVAAIHGRDAVIAMLVRDYRASVNLRDNDGKKPYHYLEKGMSCELGELLGDPHMTKPGGCQDMAERGEYREHPRRLNALSELIGHRRRYRQHTDEDAAERRDVPQTYHRRHLSNMFHLN